MILTVFEAQLISGKNSSSTLIGVEAQLIGGITSFLEGNLMETLPSKKEVIPPMSVPLLNKYQRKLSPPMSVPPPISIKETPPLVFFETIHYNHKANL